MNRGGIPGGGGPAGGGIPGPPSAPDRLAVARGSCPAPLVLKNARVLNVFTGKIDPPADIAVAGGLIAGIGRYSGAEELDLAGRMVCPGLIDGHVHLESSMVAPAEFARAVVPRGTTAVVADPHEIANVAGLDGLRYMLGASAALPLTVFLALPSCVPATPFEDAGATLEAADLAALAGDPRVVALGEVMNVPAVLSGDSGMEAKLALARASGMVIDGHAPGLSGSDLAAYVLSGASSDHECTTPAEARERLRLGMWLMIREGSAARDLDALLPVVDEASSRRCLLVTDDRNPADLLAHGHLDLMVRKAIAAGLDPVTVVRMVTLNAAERFGLDRPRAGAPSADRGPFDPVLAPRGALAPGFAADIVVLDDLAAFKVDRVFSGGRLVAEGGSAVWERDAAANGGATWDGGALKREGRGVGGGTCHVPALGPADFRVPATGGQVPVIDLLPGQIVTKRVSLTLPPRGGFLEADPAAGVAKLAVVERHRGTGRIGRGFVRGLGLAHGALASSVSHDAHNIVVAGIEDGDIVAAVRAVAEAGGGLAAVRDGRVAEILPLPIGGLVSDRPLAEVAAGHERLLAVARSWGVPATLDPFMALAFLTLAAVPELKLTDRGLVDVVAGRIVGLG